VEDAIPFAWRRAFKHHPDPPDFTKDHEKMYSNAVKQEIMSQISEWFKFEDVYDD